MILSTFGKRHSRYVKHSSGDRKGRAILSRLRSVEWLCEQGWVRRRYVTSVWNYRRRWQSISCVPLDETGAAVRGRVKIAVTSCARARAARSHADETARGGGGACAILVGERNRSASETRENPRLNTCASSR